MRVISFQILAISIISISCQTYCAVTQFDPEQIFDASSPRMGLRKLESKEFDKQKQSCFVSFHSSSLAETSPLKVKKVSDCSQHFKGTVSAGVYEGTVPTALEKKRCFWQKDWIFCFCNNNFCNWPQYWPMILARFELEFGTEIQTKEEKILRPKLQKIANVTKLHDLPKDPDYLRCLVWYADAVNQEDTNPPFYLFNYITVQQDAAAVEDALSNDPQLRTADHGKLKKKKIRYTLSEGSDWKKEYDAEIAENFKKMKLELEKSESGNQKAGIVTAVIGAVFFAVSLAGTIFYLHKLCTRLKDHSQFARVNSIANRNRYERLYRAEKVPKDYLRKKTAGKAGKKRDSAKKNTSSSSEKKKSGKKK